MAIKELLEAGKTQVEICRELNISRSTFYYDKKVIGFVCDIEQPESEPEKVASVDFKQNPENSASVLKDVSPSALSFVQEGSEPLSFIEFDKRQEHLDLVFEDFCSCNVYVKEFTFWSSG